MARKKSLGDGPVLRGQILECASRLFYERGFGATSIRDIAEGVGISSSTMYHHFTNKRDVLHAIVSRFMTDFVDATLPTLCDQSLSPTERIRRTVRLHIEISDDRRPELLVGNPIRYALDPAQKEQGVKLQTIYHDAVRDTIEEGARTGEFTVENVSITTMAVLDMLNGIREWFSPDGPLTRAEVIDRYVDLIMTILAARPATGRGPAL
ncbi:TetR/AcrR family transcriptional regulator [Streptomyces chiangmaiensis]|uniref:TetR/AcrR family transcriptional regulator n=1 Tax=Streptomyces chiangmaiensis TaxID=766497 RepID=A0ABU7FU90_9ACTN|nr:TetR/AcrR family transcriptional regulator [Streptomyces chiangmaiensis]MED7827524.1 TetR/AcrR family transcriptional regulator [Streptomyces chiangmaiensis]